MTERLFLRAEDAEDIPIFSALVQDMTVKAIDVAYDQRARRLVLMGNRYRQETDAPTRIRSALRIDSVMSVKRREWPEEAHAVLPLLAVTADSMHLELVFGGGTMIRAEVECVDLTLEDLSGPWGTRAVPRHGA